MPNVYLLLLSRPFLTSFREACVGLIRVPVRRNRIRYAAIGIIAFAVVFTLQGIWQVSPALAQEPTLQVASSDNSPALEACERITGSVVDVLGKPIAGASVKVRVISHSKNWRKSSTLVQRVLETDEQGKFELKVTESPVSDQEITFLAFVSSEKCFEKNFTEDGLEKSGKLLTLKPFELTGGTRIKGRLVAPKIDGRRPEEAIVSVYARYKSGGGSNKSIYQSLRCDRDGVFESIVPTTL